MLSHEFYNVVHILGLALALVGLAGKSATAISVVEKHRNRAGGLLAALHGLGMLLLLVGGFGMLARLGVTHGSLPGWIIAKLVIWVILGVAVAIPFRKPNLVRPVLLLAPVLAATAAWLAINKPF